MPDYYWPLLVVVLGALWLSARTPRAWLWIGGLVASFVVSVAYLRYYENMVAANTVAIAVPGGFRGEFPYINLTTDWLPPAIIGGACDALLCAGIRVAGHERWETVWLFRASCWLQSLSILCILRA